jgi:hypothetical protein
LYHPIEFLYELGTRANLSSIVRLEEAALLARWTEIGARQPLNTIPRVNKPPERLVVVMTYERPDACASLMRQLERAIGCGDARDRTALLLMRDAGEGDYSEARGLASSVASTVLWLEAREWLGKVRFWQSYQVAMLVARRWQPERTLFLHDDVEFDDDVLERADAIWQVTADDPTRRVLYLYSSDKDEPDGRWVRFARREMPDKACRLTNWVDLQAFMVDRQFFELLNYRMLPIHPNRWKRKPATSSGVGRQLTLRLRGRGTIYQAWPPLVCHGSQPSLANREARQQNDLDNRAEYARERGRLPPALSSNT